MKKNKKVKIKTTYGKILTIEISSQTDIRIVGTDMFGELVILPVEDIHSMVPLSSNKKDG